ncbi:hypothetical protein FRC03_005573, partial [Tulasnella sp. 419]
YSFVLIDVTITATTGTTLSTARLPCDPAIATCPTSNKQPCGHLHAHPTSRLPVLVSSLVSEGRARSPWLPVVLLFSVMEYPPCGTTPATLAHCLCGELVFTPISYASHITRLPNLPGLSSVYGQGPYRTDKFGRARPRKFQS